MSWQHFIVVFGIDNFLIHENAKMAELNFYSICVSGLMWKFSFSYTNILITSPNLMCIYDPPTDVDIAVTY